MQDTERELTIIPYKMGSFCNHRSDKSMAPYVDVVCNRKQETYHRVSQIGKICNKCGETIVRTALISEDCLYCSDKIEDYLQQMWICHHQDPIYEEITIKCLDNAAETHQVPFKSKVCKRCFDKIRAAFMYSNSCAVCAEKENDILQNIQKTITLPAHYFYAQAVKEIRKLNMTDEQARQQIQNYCLAAPRKEVDSKLKKLLESMGANQQNFHESKRYQLYPKCPKHRNAPVSLCNSCLAALLNVDSCPYGCPYAKEDKKVAKKPEDQVKIFEGGFVYFYPKETKGQPYLESFVFRIEEASKFDRWEGRIKKIKLSENSAIKDMNRFSLFAAVAQESETRFLYTGGAAGVPINSLKTTRNSFWITFSSNKKQFALEDVEPMAQARSSHSSVYHNGYVYAFGGFVREDQKCLNSCQRFDVKKGKWQKIAPMKIQRSKPTVLVYKDNIYVIGGMSPNNEYTQNICEKYNIGKEAWQTIVFDGFGIPFVSGSSTLSSKRDTVCENILVFGGSDLSCVTKVVQSMVINEKKNQFDINYLGTTQNLNFNRSNASVCLMNTDNPNQKIALLFGGLEEHEPMLSLDAVRIKYQKGERGEQIVPFFVYDDIEVGSYRLLLRESASSTYEFMMNKLLEQKILSKQKFEKDSDNILKSEFNIHMIEKMWYGIGKCLMPLTL